MKEKKSSTAAGGNLNSHYFLGVELNMNGDIWEEVPDEDLWEDGELNLEDVQSKVFRYLDTGKYMLIRRKDE